jgi:hypothetical protein
VSAPPIPASGLAPLVRVWRALFGASVASWRPRCFLITSPLAPLFFLPFLPQLPHFWRISPPSNRPPPLPPCAGAVSPACAITTASAQSLQSPADGCRQRSLALSHLLPRRRRSGTITELVACARGQRPELHAVHRTRSMPTTTLTHSGLSPLRESFLLSLTHTHLENATVQAAGRSARRQGFMPHGRCAAASHPTPGRCGAPPSIENPHWLRMSLWSLQCRRSHARRTRSPWKLQAVSELWPRPR